MEKNVKRPKEYSQVCVWPGTIVTKEKIQDFVKFMADKFDGVRVMYLEEIKTGPDTKNGEPVEGTGGRTDLFFAVHNDDIMKFSIPRLLSGIQWIEDTLAVGNYTSRIYPERVFKYCTWNEEALAIKK